MKGRKYSEYFKSGLRSSLEYKGRLVASFFGPFILIGLAFIVWKYIFLIKGGGAAGFEIGGFTFEEMVVYYVIVFLFDLCIPFGIFLTISSMIKEGDVTLYLSKPVSFPGSLLAKSIGDLFIKFIAFIILILIIIGISIGFPGLSRFILFLVYAVALFLFYVLEAIIVGGFAFWLTEVWGINAAVKQIEWVLGGKALPLSLFPAWFTNFAAFTPFMYLEYTLARIFIGNVAVAEGLRALGIFCVWILILSTILAFVYRRGFKKMETLGG